MTILDNIKNVYFVGIGGIGMSALARYFKLKGYNVAGYDRTQTPLTEKMAREEGIAVNYADDENEIAEIYRNAENTLVVYTPAIPRDNRQLNFFTDRGMKPHKRSEVLGLLSHAGKALCIAGTHGKTTTSTLLAWLALLQCGARVLPLNPQLPAALLQELLPALTVQHQLVLNGDALPGDLPALTLQAAAGTHAVPWRGDRSASMTLTSGWTTLVGSCVPPRPTSITAASTFSRANQVSAIAVPISKTVGYPSPLSSMACTCAETSVVSAARVSSGISPPLMRILSL